MVSLDMKLVMCWTPLHTCGLFFSTEALLNSLLVVHFGLSDASLQSSSSTAVHIPVSRPEGALSLPQKFLSSFGASGWGTPE